jgi:hypothetical protein
VSGDRDSLQRLLDIEEIKQLKARYFRLLDAKEWDAWRQLFTEDARFEVPMPGDLSTRDSFVEVVKSNLADARTAHHGHMPEIEILNTTTARGTWALADYVELAPVDNQRAGIRGYGHYHERYRKDDGRWRISELVLRYLRLDPLLGEPLLGPSA